METTRKKVRKSFINNAYDDVSNFSRGKLIAFIDY